MIDIISFLVRIQIGGIFCKLYMKKKLEKYKNNNYRSDSTLNYFNKVSEI